MLSWVGVFLAVFFLDFVWAKYTQAINAKHPGWSATFAAGIICLSGSAAVGYTSDPWLLLPAAGGAFTGTYAAVKYGAK